MSRLSLIEREQLTEEQRRFHDAVKAIRQRAISGPFIPLMNSSPDLAARFAHLGHYFLSRGQTDQSILPLRLRTFIALICARTLDVPYEWSAWAPAALEAGVPQGAVDDIREWRKPQNVATGEALAYDVCTQLMTTPHCVNDATYKAALEHFGAQGLVELVMTLGYFAMIAFPLNAFEIEMSAGQKATRKPCTPLIIAANSGQTAGRREVTPFAHRKAGERSSRIPLIARHADLKAEHQHLFDRIVLTRGHVPGVFQVLLNTPHVAHRVANVGAFLLYEGMLPQQIKMLVWLITAREFDCEYEWGAGASHARKAGLPQELIDAISRGARPASLSEEQAEVLAFCHELMRGAHHISEKTYGAVVARFGVPAAVQIVATLGYFAMMAYVLNAFEVAPDVDESRPAM